MKKPFETPSIELIYLLEDDFIVMSPDQEGGGFDFDDDTDLDGWL